MDGAVAAWLVLWLVMGGWSAYTIWELSGLGDTVTNSGRAIGSAGTALESFGDVPVVGERPGKVGRETVVAGAEIEIRGQEVKRELRQLSILIGLAIALMPTTPVAGLYVPLRLSRRRERRQLVQTLRAHADDAGFDRYLAERAVRHLSWGDLRAVDDDPWGAIAEGRTTGLATAELRRLGLSRPRG